MFQFTALFLLPWRLKEEIFFHLLTGGEDSAIVSGLMKPWKNLSQQIFDVLEPVPTLAISAYSSAVNLTAKECLAGSKLFVP
jgi:hypothetical protein